MWQGVHRGAQTKQEERVRGILVVTIFLDIVSRNNQIWIGNRSDGAEITPEANYHHQKNWPLRPSVTQKCQAWGVTMLIGGLTAPTAPIVVPTVPSLLWVKWIYDVYQQLYVFFAMPCWNAKQENLRALMLQCLMVYIVDFTIIMQVIFGLMVNTQLHLSRCLIKLVVKVYSISEERSEVHKEIKEHVKLAGHFGQNAAPVKIIQLIKEYQMKLESMDELQGAVKMFENNENENWGIGKVCIEITGNLSDFFLQVKDLTHAD